MQINFTVIGGGALITTQKLRFTAAQEDSINAIVASLTMDPPHAFPMDVTLNVPNPVPHRVRIYSTPDATPGTLVAEFTYDPTYTNVRIRAKLELLVGGSGPFDPADGATMTPIIPDLIGWDWYPEMRSKQGSMAAAEYTKIESVPGAGFDRMGLTGDDVFVAPDYLFIHFLPQVTVSQPVYNYLNLYTDIKEIPTSVTMDDTFYRKLCEFTSAGASPIVDFLALSTVPEGTLLTFSTMRGAQKQATLRAFPGEFLIYGNTNYPALFMGQMETLWLLRRADGWHVANDWKGMATVGQLVDMEMSLPNTVLYNGGGLVDGGGNPIPILRAQYPRAEWYVLSRLPAGQILTIADRIAGGILKSGYWAYDATNLYAPDYQGNSRRTLPGTRGNDSDRNNASLPGSYEADQVIKHTHFIATGERVDNNGFPLQPSATKSMVIEWVKNAGAGAPGYYLVGSPTNAVPVSGPTSPAGGTDLGATGETRGRNNGCLTGCYI